MIDPAAVSLMFNWYKAWKINTRGDSLITSEIAAIFMNSDIIVLRFGEVRYELTFKGLWIYYCISNGNLTWHSVFSNL